MSTGVDRCEKEQGNRNGGGGGVYPVLELISIIPDMSPKHTGRSTPRPIEADSGTGVQKEIRWLI